MCVGPLPATRKCGAEGRSVPAPSATRYPPCTPFRYHYKPLQDHPIDRSFRCNRQIAEFTHTRAWGSAASGTGGRHRATFRAALPRSGEGANPHNTNTHNTKLIAPMSPRILLMISDRTRSNTYPRGALLIELTQRACLPVPKT